MPAMWSRRQRRARVFRVRKEPTMSSRFGRGTGEVRTLSHLIDVLAEHGDRQAVLALQGEGTESWSYEELAECARRLAHGLTEAGVGRGDHVMLFAPSRPEWMVACLAIGSWGCRNPCGCAARGGGARPHSGPQWCQVDFHHDRSDREARAPRHRGHTNAYPARRG